MRLYERADGNAVREIKMFAEANVCDSEKFSSEDFTYIFEKEGAIATFILKDKNGFKSDLLIRKKPVALQTESMKELIANNYVLYESGEEK